MVIRLEESIAAVCAPSPGPQADLRVCEVLLESIRYLVYAADSLLVILVEARPVSTTAARDPAQRTSKFELWQTWNAHDPIRCVRFNPSNKVARGALALCTDEGRGVLLMPASVTSSRAAAVAETSRASNMEDEGKRVTSTVKGSDLILRSDYVKAHLHLHLPRWAESVRWQCDDGLLNHLEWMESRGNLFLLGAGEKLCIWKLVEDTEQVYLQRTMALSRGRDVPIVPVCHFDVAPSGRFAATAGKHDRIVKVWNLGELSPHEGTSVSLFLAHTRALVRMTWSKEVNVYNAQSTVALNTDACEMLFTLDRGGNISIWRENLAPLRLFVLWKQFAATDFCSSPFNKGSESLETHIRVFGLVNHSWAQEVPKVSSVSEALLSESAVMDALCLFHYGYSSLIEAHQNELANQRMDSITQMNNKLLGDRSGTVADTHVGEAFICGNVALEQTFAVHLIYGVLSNGDFCIFRGASIPFTGVSPRLSLLLSYSGLQEQLIDAHVYSVSSSGYQDQGSGSTVFYVELLFQQKMGESYLYCARLKLQANNPSVGTCREPVLYTVSSCEVSVTCSNMMSAMKEGNGQDASFFATYMAPWCESGWHADSSGCTVKFAVTNIGGCLNVFQTSGSLRKLEIAFQSKSTSALGPVTHTASYEKRSVLYFLSGGKLHVAMMAPWGTPQVEKVIDDSSMELSGPQRDSTLLAAGQDALALSVCYIDGSNDCEVLDQLISVAIPESVKVKWSNVTVSTQVATSNPAKDYSMVVGMHKGGKKLTVWVFSIEITVLEPLASSVLLFRKTMVDLPEARLLDIATVPLLNTFEITLASFDTDLQLTRWTFTDLDDLLEVKPAYRVDVGELMRMASRAQKLHMEFHTTEQELVFKHFGFSSCGRVAVLFGGGNSEDDDQICFLPTTESLVEGVVRIPHKQFGQAISLEWTPPVTPERDCELLFLSTTTIAMLKFDYLRPTNKWSIAWSASRFSVRPEKISSLSSYPYALLRIGFSLAHLNLQDIDGVGSSQLPPKHCPREQVLGPQPPSNVFPAHHPVTLMYLLARGSFETVEKVFEHVKTRILEHEETCYLRMADDTVLRTLPLLPLSQLLGDPTSTEDNCDERPHIYLSGSERHYAASMAPARASDLFAMDFRAPRRYEASGGSNDRADMLFAPSPPSLHDVEENKPRTSVKLKVETDMFSKFFTEHKASLTFMTTQESNTFLTIVAGIKKSISWERDSSRQKDEAALRFHTSLLWPTDRPASIQRAAADSDASEQQTVSEAKAPTSICLGTEGLCSEQVAWGALSDFQPELLQECFPGATMSWKEMKRLRLPFWLRSSTKLLQFTEKVAQVEYAANRDPFAVAVFYVLLRKTRLLASLFKMAHESRISDLLSNNFSDLRWKNAAIKNAYVLKTKQRYELSAAFFLLGGKVVEAVSVAEQADATLVLSFLIARISEKWDLVQADALGSRGVADLSQASSVGLTTNFRELAGHSETSSAMLIGDNSSESKNLCADFLRTTVYEKAFRRGDLYMCFLAKYLLGETSNAIDILVTPPAVEMRSMFGDLENSGMDPSSIYWSVFGKSLLGACNLVRFLRKKLLPMKLALKEKVLRLNTSALRRMQDAGFGIAALLHQRDTASFVQEFRRERATSSDAVAFLGCRQRVLLAAVGSQVEFLYATFLQSMHDVMKIPATSASSTRFDLEEQLNEEIQCIVRLGGNYDLPGVLETSKKHLQHRVQAAVVESLARSGRLAALDILVSGWSHSESSSPCFAFTSSLSRFVEAIAEGVATVASGDLMSTATGYLHIRKVDQICSNLLAMAMQLLLWLQYRYLKPSKQRATLRNREFVRVAVAAVHSAISICCRYLKNPCCLYRVLSLIFPHIDGLSPKSEEALNDIIEGDVCVRCAPIRRSTTAPVKMLSASSFQQDVPVLYQAVRILELELDEFTAAVKTSRLHHLMPSRDLPTPLFSYCSYWELVLMMAADAMPAHLSKIAGEGVACTSGLSNKLVDAWVDCSNRLASIAVKHLLCDLAKLFFSPFAIPDPTTSLGVTSTGSPRGSSSPAQSSPPPFLDIPGSTLSPPNFDRARRQLLKCECERCPWLLLVDLFTDKTELLLRLKAQVECCSEKVDAEVRWGRLPEPVSRRFASARSQKVLVSTAAGNSSTLSHTTNSTGQLKRHMTSTSTAVHVRCVYRCETPIKAMCFNRAAGDDTEMSICTSKGISRASCMDYADGCSTFQFKGMYARPQNSTFFPPDSTLSSPVKGRQTPDTSIGSSHRRTLTPSLTTRRNGALSPRRSPVHLLASPSELKLASFKPTTVTTHPFLPLFVSGNHKGCVHLWSYDRLSALCAFQTKDFVAVGNLYPASPSMSSGRTSIEALEFDSLGQQLGAVDAGGHLFLWKFSELDRAPYYREIMCHDKGAKGLAFLNSSSTIVTVGLSSKKRNVCVWDTLLPTPKALIAAPACHPAGATSAVFSSTHQLLITGGTGGALSIFDMRRQRVLHTISNAHETPIKTLVLHPSGDCVLSGSASGDVKIWSLPLFREAAFLSKVHVKPSFLGDAATNFLGDAASNVAINVTNFSWGVTDAVATKDAFYTSGADGSVHRLTLPSLRTRL